MRLDGATLDQWTPEALGRHIGYLPQSLADAARQRGREYRALRSGGEGCRHHRGGAHRRGARDDPRPARRLCHPYGPDDGQPLSGGQIQRLGLARAVYGAPRLIVLDEPNSNLDADGDDALSQAIRTMRASGSVVVVMAHRPSAIAAVNKILLLHQGRAAKFGDKDEVLQQAPSGRGRGTVREMEMSAADALSAPSLRPTCRGRAASAFSPGLALLTLVVFLGLHDPDQRRGHCLRVGRRARQAQDGAKPRWRRRRGDPRLGRRSGARGRGAAAARSDAAAHQSGDVPHRLAETRAEIARLRAEQANARALSLSTMTPHISTGSRSNRSMPGRQRSSRRVAR